MPRRFRARGLARRLRLLRSGSGAPSRLGLRPTSRSRGFPRPQALSGPLASEGFSLDRLGRPGARLPSVASQGITPPGLTRARGRMSPRPSVSSTSSGGALVVYPSPLQNLPPTPDTRRSLRDLLVSYVGSRFLRGSGKRPGDTSTRPALPVVMDVSWAASQPTLRARAREGPLRGRLASGQPSVLQPMRLRLICWWPFGQRGLRPLAYPIGQLAASQPIRWPRAT